MPLVRRIIGVIPAPVRRKLLVAREQLMLARVPRQSCDTSPLRRHAELSLSSVLGAGDWSEAQAKIRALGLAIPERSGGVNPGDQRAIFQIVAALRPASVLEIGTHIGASTLHIALALDSDARLVTVDFRDVNDPEQRPWVRYGANRSPSDLVALAGRDSVVDFVTCDAMSYFTESDELHDLIFLDGDHSAAAVYQEIAAALRRLKEGGVILLHDYFPQGERLWSSSAPIIGPYLAVRRLCAEGVNMRALPLGKLPWPTKLGSDVSSLALLLRPD